LIRAESEGPTAGADEIFQPTAYLPQILHGIYRQTRYPEADDDTDEAEFEEYRRSLYKIYVNITRKRPLETLAFLTTMSQEMPMQVQQVEARDLESYISLVHRYMEGIAAMKAKKELESPSSPLTAIVVKIHSNLIAGATLPGGKIIDSSVLLTYYDLAQRYSRVLQNQSALIPAVLDMMFGANGLTNADAHVRSRVCYLCLQLVKAINTSVHPHVENILRALVPRLVVPDQDEAAARKNDPTFIPYDDQVYLFELAGQVIASLVPTPENAEIKYQYTKMVLEPLVAALNVTLSALATGARDEEQAAEHSAKLLNAIANVSKAFKGVNCMTNQQELFTSVLNGTAFVLRAMPRHRSVRSKVVFALHRFITILDSEHLLSNVSEILEHLMFGCEFADVLEVVQLLDQLIIRYKDALFPFFDQFTMAFVQHLCGLMPPRNATADSETKDAPQLEREAIQKYLYTFLLHVTVHNLSTVFVSVRNVAQLENVLLLVLEGCADVTDTNTNRACFTIAHELVSRWLLSPTPPTELAAETKARFTQFIVERFTPAMFALAKKHHFEVHDAQCAAVMKEIRTLHEVLLKALGEEFLRYLRDVCLPSLGCPMDLAASYAAQIATGDEKIILTVYKQFVSRLK
jgi:exportin-T